MVRATRRERAELRSNHLKNTRPHDAEDLKTWACGRFPHAASTWSHLVLPAQPHVANLSLAVHHVVSALCEGGRRSGTAGWVCADGVVGWRLLTVLQRARSRRVHEELDGLGLRTRGRRVGRATRAGLPSTDGPPARTSSTFCDAKCLATASASSVLVTFCRVLRRKCRL